MRRKDGREKTFAIRYCAVCGKEYTPKSSTAKYCPQCREILKKNYQKAKDIRRRLSPAYKKWHTEYERERKQELREKIWDDFGHLCWLCGKSLKKGQWVRHHVSYSPEKIVLLCRGCHAWLHGQRGTFRHVIKEKYPPDVAPYIFARRVVELYEDHYPLIKRAEIWLFDDLLNFIRQYEHLSDEEISTIKLEAELKRTFAEEKKDE